MKVVTNQGGLNVTTNFSSPGRLRPRGQSTLAIGSCMGMGVPWLLDFSSHNKQQTLFGVEKAYLRTHMSDASFMREWSMHRMLARFELPYLRVRSVKLFFACPGCLSSSIAGVAGHPVWSQGSTFQAGVYSLMEAPDQRYVFARSFPAVNFNKFSLYKVKTMAMDCGHYTPAELAAAPVSNSKSTYSFTRGSHRQVRAGTFVHMDMHSLTHTFLAENSYPRHFRSMPQ
jgi:hypothetical protein